MLDDVQTLSEQDVKYRLQQLAPDIPWTHHFEIAGVETITRDFDEKFYKKSIAAKALGSLAMTYCKVFGEGRPLSDTRILDVASAEGGLGMSFAQAGAKEVVGIEGRSLYVQRANFVADALGVTNMRTQQGDVRHIRREDVGTFHFTINSGILHHLGQPDFFPFLQAMADVTSGTMFLYTHVSTPEGVRDFRLKGPVQAEGRFEGYLLQEHAEDATAEERENQVRASLDNTYSFWATEESLVAALKAVGFDLISKIYEPHAFGSHINRNLRVIFICKKL